MEVLWVKMAVAGALAVLAEFAVTYLLVSFLSLPLWVLAVGLPLFWLFQWLISPSLIRRGAREVTNDPAYSWLRDMVYKIAETSHVKPPRVYITDDPFPNAFAFGNLVEGRGVAVTRPLLEILNEDELYAVLAHEVGHVRHFDMEVVLALGLIPSALGSIGSFLLYGGQILLTAALDEAALFMGLLMLAAGFLLVAATFFIQIFVLWFNRLRESYADLHAARLLGPSAVNLARALAKIQIYMSNVRVDPFRGIVLTVPPMKIKETDPDDLLRRWASERVSPLADMLSTHPHPAKRIKAILGWTAAGRAP
ncbi:MAG: zinc metalloprotease HtpX [Thermoproteus sp.]